MTAYKQIQLTNSAIPDVAVNAYMPLGKVTRRINAPYTPASTFVVTTSAADSVVINDAGFYKITYSLTAEVAAAGTVTVALVVNDNVVYSVSEYAADAEQPVNLTLPYTIRVASNCSAAPTNVPTVIQIQNTGLALTGQSGNLIIEKVQ